MSIKTQHVFIKVNRQWWSQCTWCDGTGTLTPMFPLQNNRPQVCTNCGGDGIDKPVKLDFSRGIWIVEVIQADDGTCRTVATRITKHEDCIDNMLRMLDCNTVSWTIWEHGEIFTCSGDDDNSIL